MAPYLFFIMEEFIERNSNELLSHTSGSVEFRMSCQAVQYVTKIITSFIYVIRTNKMQHNANANKNPVGLFL
jgi:hypothetical protein